MLLDAPNEMTHVMHEFHRLQACSENLVTGAKPLQVDDVFSTTIVMEDTRHMPLKASLAVIIVAIW